MDIWQKQMANLIKQSVTIVEEHNDGRNQATTPQDALYNILTFCFQVVLVAVLWFIL